MQLNFAGMPAAPDRRPRRQLWRLELARVAAYHDDRLVRAEARHQQDIARLTQICADLRDRVADIEHSSGLADLGVAPRRSAELRAFAR
jgi:hypothetical protein